MTSPQQAQKAVDPEKARDDLINKFEEQTSDLKNNTAYYESDRRPDAVGIAVPEKMRDLLAHVGYPRLYVDSIAERQELEGFRLGGADDADQELWDWWQANDLDIEATLGHTDALVHGRSYITVAAPDPKFDLNVDPEVPIIRVEPPTSLYADVDPRTRQVTQAIRVIYNEDEEIIGATLYLPDRTMIWDRAEGQYLPPRTITHGLEMVPVIPITNRARLSDLYGTSAITPEIRSVTDAAARIMMDMQATAEIMAIPQRLIFGAKPKEVGVDPETGQKLFNAYIAGILAFEEENGKAMQFSAAELRNFVDALDALDKKAAGYTGLPPQYLSFSSENPASAEAIKASESRLVKTVERKNKIFGGAWEQAMRVAYRIIKGGDIPPEYFRMETVWRDPSTPTYAAKADAASKLYANGLGVIPKERARKDMGYSDLEREEMRTWDAEEDKAIAALGMIATPSAKAQPKPEPTTAAKPTETKTASPQT